MKKSATKKKKNVEIPEFRLKCKSCKKVMGFYLHECPISKGVIEYCGCEKCDNYCTKCREFEWQKTSK
jgi:hypothetical protein